MKPNDPAGLDPGRIRDLDRRAAQALRAAVAAFGAHRLGEASECVFAARVVAPSHPEPMLWQARIQRALGRIADARATIAGARQIRSDDPTILLESARLAFEDGDAGAGESALAEALSLAAERPADLAAVAEVADAQGAHAIALAAAERLLGPRAGETTALLFMARNLTATGRIAEAAKAYRDLLRRDPAHAGAWWALADLKTIRLDDAEIAALERQYRIAKGPPAGRALLGFALGQALEALGRHDEAFAALVSANAIVREFEPWSPEAFADQTSANLVAFDPPPAGGRDQGAEVIFLVGLPRSGSTLVEQVLAGHPSIEGASELPSLDQVLAEESARRRRAYPEWVREASPSDWSRLGERYLGLTRRWRRRRPISTDKLPENWRHAGAIRAMLPGARIIDCRRDPVEIAWSCFRQRFAPGRVSWAQDVDWIARYLAEARHFGDRMAQLHPSRYRIQTLEALVESPEAEARALFAFLGLVFDPRCLDTHRTERAVRTASAAQVRQPMRMPASRSQAYGALLDPIRDALAARTSAP
jgi:tetratricopeptide (TPR) repeat protein